VGGGVREKTILKMTKLSSIDFSANPLESGARKKRGILRKGSYRKSASFKKRKKKLGREFENQESKEEKNLFLLGREKRKRKGFEGVEGIEGKKRESEDGEGKGKKQFFFQLEKQTTEKNNKRGREEEAKK